MLGKPSKTLTQNKRKKKEEEEEQEEEGGKENKPNDKCRGLSSVVRGCPAGMKPQVQCQTIKIKRQATKEMGCLQ